MLDRVLSDASRICANIPSFSEVLDVLRKKRSLSQKQLSTHLYRSEAEISRLLNNQMPKKLGVTDIHQMARCLNCTRIELVELIEAFVCYTLNDHEMIDLDTF
jgi:transcriptional regulator with XRE-family HTH domain